MLDLNINRIYECWNVLIQSAEREDIENELKSLCTQCKNAFESFMNYVPNYKGLYRVERIIFFERFKRVYGFLSMLKLESKQVYNKFTENHDIVNLKEYLGFEGKDFSKGITKLHALKEYSYFLSHLILRIYDEKDEAKKKAMLESMM